MDWLKSKLTSPVTPNSLFSSSPRSPSSQPLSPSATSEVTSPLASGLPDGECQQCQSIRKQGEAWGALDETVNTYLCEQWTLYCHERDGNAEEQHLRKALIDYLSTYNGFHGARLDVLESPDNANLIYDRDFRSSPTTAPSSPGNESMALRPYPLACTFHLLRQTLEESLQAQDSEALMHLFQHFQVLTTHVENHHPFVDHPDGIDALLRGAVLMWATYAGNGSERDVFLERATIALLETIQNLVDRRRAWKEFLVTWQIAPFDPSSPFNINSTAEYLSMSIPLLVGLLLDVLDKLGNRSDLTLRQYSIVMQVFNTFGSLLFSRWSGSTILVLHQSEGWVPTLRFVRWPTFVQDLKFQVDAETSWADIAEMCQERVDPAKLRTEYRLQLLALHVASVAVERLYESQLEYAPSWEAVDAAIRESAPVLSAPFVRDFANWISCFAGHFHSDEESYVGLNSYPLVASFLPEMVRECKLEAAVDPPAEGAAQKRITSKHTQESCPVATQEMDLLFRLLLSYVNRDLRFGGGLKAGRWTLRQALFPSESKSDFPLPYQIETLWTEFRSKALPCLLPRACLYQLELLQRLSWEEDNKAKHLDEVLYELTQANFWERLFADDYLFAASRLDSGKVMTASAMQDVTVPRATFTSEYLRSVLNRMQVNSIAIIHASARHTNSTVVMGAILTQTFALLERIDSGDTTPLQILEAACKQNRFVFTSCFHELEGVLKTFAVIPEPVDLKRPLTASARSFLDTYFLNQQISCINALQDQRSTWLVKWLEYSFHANPDVRKWAQSHVWNLIDQHRFLDPNGASNSYTFVTETLRACLDRDFQDTDIVECVVDLLSGMKTTLSSCRGDAKLRWYFGYSAIVAHLLSEMFSKAAQMDDTSTSKLRLLCAVLETIIMCMAGSEKQCKQQFANAGVFDTIVMSLRKSKESLRDTKLLDALCGMWIDRCTWHVNAACPETLRNPASVIVLLRLLPDLRTDQKTLVLDRFLILLNKNSLNLTKISLQYPELPMDLINGVLPKLTSDESVEHAPVEDLELFQRILGLTLPYSATIKSLSELFAVLLRRSAPSTLSLSLLRSVQAALDVPEVPGATNFFTFSGKQSGILLPMTKLAGDTGYTLAMWFRVHSFEEEFLRFRSVNVFHAPEPNSERSDVVHHQADSEARGTEHPRLFSLVSKDSSYSWEAFFQDGALKVEIRNGQGSVHEVKTGFAPDTNRWYFIAFTQPKPAVKKFGRSAANVQKELCVYIDGTLYGSWKLDFPSANNEYEYCTIAAQCAPVGDTKEELRHSFAGDIASISLWQHYLDASCVETAYRQQDRNLKGAPAFPPAAVQFDPFAFDMDSNTCHNIAPGGGTTGYIGLLQNSYRCIRMPLKDGFRSCNGFVNLLQLVEWSSDPVLLLSILNRLLKGNYRNWKAFKACGGICLVMHLLRKGNITSYSDTLVDVLLGLSETLRKQEFDMEDEVKVIHDIWLDFRFWSKTSETVQMPHLRQLADIYRNFQDLGKIYGVRYLLAQVDMIYGEPDRKNTRKALLCIIEDVFRQTASKSVLTDMLQFAVGTDSKQTTTDLLGICDRVISTSDPVENFRLWTAEIMGDPLYIGNLLSSDCEEIHIKCLRLLELASQDGRYDNLFAPVCKVFERRSLSVAVIEAISAVLSATRNLRIVYDISACMFETLPHAADHLVSSRILKLLADAIAFKQGHLNAYLDTSFWIPSLARFLCDAYGVVDATEQYEAALVLVSDIFTHLARTEVEAWRIVEDMSKALWSQAKSVHGARILDDLSFKVYRNVIAMNFTDIFAHNLLCMISLSEELHFYYRDYASVVKKVAKNSSTLKSRGLENLKQVSSVSIGSVESTESHESEMDTQGGKLVYVLVRAMDRFHLINAEKLSFTQEGSDTPMELRDGGVFRIIVRIALQALMCMDPKVRATTADLLRRLFDLFSPNENNTNTPTLAPFFRKEPRVKLMAILGWITDAFLMEPEANHVPELATLFTYVIRRWKLHLVSHIPCLNEALPTNAEEIDKFLQTPQWVFASEMHLITAVKEMEESFEESIHSARKRYEMSCKLSFAQWRLREESVQRHRVPFQLDCSLREKIATDFYKMILNERKELQQKLEEEMNNKLDKLHFALSQPNSCIGSEEYHWQLDAAENRMRMRKKRTFNLEFNDHKEASMRRDRAHSREPTRTTEITAALRRSSVPTQTSEETDDWDLLAQDDGEVYRSLDTFLFATDCELVLMMTSIKGKLEISTHYLKFTADRADVQAKKDSPDVALTGGLEFVSSRQWDLADLHECFPRRYKLKRNSLEFFFLDRTNVFFTFAKNDFKVVYKKIVSLKPPNLLRGNTMKPLDYLKQSQLTERWQRREISNFEYVMGLNSVAGRTYNDLTQYPVFPWILTDYSSPTLDLADPGIYRDLSKPIGALSEKRLQHFVDRFNSLDKNSDVPKFYYGTHYSSAASVLFYMLRVEPFTTHHIALQAGRFDHPDRQFHDIAATWRSCLENTGDVKELIPEFFYLPEMFRNRNHFDLGRKQTGVELGDVLMPKWAETPEEFVRIHREALESDYVSEHLDEWIDLIFGYKQTGSEAIKAHNVFFHLTYEGAIDLDAITDPIERQAMEAQIVNFGQTPSRLFEKKHPKRFPRLDVGELSIFQHFSQFQTLMVPMELPWMEHMLVTEVTEYHTSLQIMTQETVGTYRIVWNGDANAPFAVERYREEPHSIFSRSLVISRESLVFAVSRTGKWVASASKMNGSIFLASLESKDVAGILRWHDGLVTALVFSDGGRYLASGGMDAVIIIWKLGKLNGAGELDSEERVQHVLYGHDAPITSIIVSEEYDLVATCATNENCFVYQLSSGVCLHRLEVSVPGAIAGSGMNYRLRLSPNGELFVFHHYGTQEQAIRFHLTVFTVNGTRLNSVAQPEPGLECLFDASSNTDRFIVVHPSAVYVYRIQGYFYLMQKC